MTIITTDDGYYQSQIAALREENTSLKTTVKYLDSESDTLQAEVERLKEEVKYWKESQAYAENQYLFQVAYNKTQEGTIKEYAAEVDQRKEYTDMMEDKLRERDEQLSRYESAVEVEGYVTGCLESDMGLYFASGWSKELKMFNNKRVRVLVMADKSAMPKEDA